MRCIFLLSAVLAAAAPRPPACPAPSGAVEIVLPSGLPAALRGAMGDVAMPGEPFDQTDVYLKGHPHSRYLFVWNQGRRWIVAMEQGGKVLRTVVFVFDLGEDGKTAILIEQHNTFPNRVKNGAG